MMFGRFGIAIAVVVCSAAQSWAGVRIEYAQVSFGGMDWVVNRILADVGSTSFTNGGFVLSTGSPGMIYQENTPLFGEPNGGNVISRPIGKTGFDTNHPSGPGIYNEITDYPTLRYDTYVQDGRSDPGSTAVIAGKSGLGSLDDPTVPIFDTQNIDIGWFQPGNASTGIIEIAQVTLKTTANGTSLVQIFVGGSTPINQPQFLVHNGAIGEAPPPVVPLPAGILPGVVLVFLGRLLRRPTLG